MLRRRVVRVELALQLEVPELVLGVVAVERVVARRALLAMHQLRHDVLLRGRTLAARASWHR